jgi:hypothetical protein
MSAAYTNHGKTTSAKRNSGRKSTLAERDRRTLRRTVSKNEITTAAQVTEQQTSWRPCLHKTVRRDVSFINPTSTVGMHLLNLWLLQVMLRCVNSGVTTTKPGHQTTENAHVVWSDESSSTPFPTSGGVYVWRTPKEAYNSECLVQLQQWNMGRFSDGSGSNIVVQYSVGPIITLHGRITAKEYVDKLGNQVHPMIQTLILNNTDP